MATAAGAMLASPSHTMWGHQFVGPSSDAHRSGASFLLTRQTGLPQSAGRSLARGDSFAPLRRTAAPLRRRTIAASAEDQVVDGSEEGKAESTSSNSNGKPPPTPSPFASGKISSKIAAKSTQSAENGRTAAPAAQTTAAAPPATKIPASIATKAPADPVSAPRPSVFTTATKPSISVKPKSLVDDGSQGAFPTGKVSPFAADRLKSQMASPPSQYNRTSSGRTMINSGKQVLEAFKQGEKDGKRTKFGQPIVPKNIFDDVRRTPEEIEADKFKFSLSPGDIFLGFSFVIIVGVMLGTAFIVWKLGAIHYNE